MRSVALALALGLASGVAPGVARAKRPTTAELAQDGLTDPRRRPPPPTHRLRLALMSDYVRGSAARSDSGRTTRFHFAPLLIDLAYQVQILKYMMIRPSFAFGMNVANTRNAMRLALQPGIFMGYQGAILGVAAGYTAILPFPLIANQTDGHLGQPQPVMYNHHAIQAEVSFTTRVDRGALNFAARFGLTHYHLVHLDLDKKRWAPILTLSAGWFFDLTRRRSRAR